jgi:hypothetical protein
MHQKIKTARIAGLIYVIMAIVGAFSILYVPSTLIDWDNPQTTVENIIASETLFRLGIFSGILSNLLFLVLPFVLYKLLKSIDETMAAAMVILVVISIPVSLIAQVNQYDVLTLITNYESLNILGEEHVHAQVMSSLHAYNNGIFIATLFWGLWLYPFGYLVYKSELLPKFFGIFLMAGCFGYLIEFIGMSMWPTFYHATGVTNFIHIPSAIGEIGIAFWLLIFGIKKRFK